MSVEIIYPSEKYFKSFHHALDQIAKEQIYIEMIEAKSFEDVASFQAKLISNNWPVYYAINSDVVVGWVDISLSSNPRLSHRGHLGMGLIKDFRGQGIGSQLLSQSLKHAKQIGLEKVELSVYTSNTAAFELYKKFGFSEIGIIKNFRKLNDKYFDAIEMEKFLEI